MSVYRGRFETFYGIPTDGDRRAMAKFDRKKRRGQLKAQRTRKHNKGDHSTCVKSECAVAKERANA